MLLYRGAAYHRHHPDREGALKCEYHRGYWIPICSTGVSDDELTAGSYDSIYGFHGDKEYKGVFNDNDLSTDGSKVAFKASGQWFARWDEDSWNGKASGSFDFPLIGLTPNTAYTNHAKGSDFPSYPYQEVVQDTSNVLLRNGVHVKTPVDIRQVALYAQPIYKDSNTKVSHWVEDNENALKFVPDFTTKSVAAAKPAETLPDKTDVKAEVAGGKVEPGKTARVYIDNLKDEAKGKPSDSNRPAATRPSASDRRPIPRTMARSRGWPRRALTCGRGRCAGRPGRAGCRFYSGEEDPLLNT